MFTLSRKTYPDVLMRPEDLDDVAELWQIWYDRAHAAEHRGYQAVRLRLWGVATPDVGQMSRKLGDRLAAQSLDAEVTIDLAGYLVASSPFELLPDACLFGAWLAAVSERSFDGLVAFFELSIHDWPGPPEGTASAGGTIVLCGLLKPNGFLLKAAWPVGLEPGIENLYKLTVWPEEERFLHALKALRDDGSLHPAPSNYFESRPAQQRTNWFARLIIHVPGEGRYRQGRLQSVFFRIGVHAGSIAFDLLTYFMLPDWPAKGILLGLLILPIGILAYILWVEAVRIWSFYWRMKAALRRVYEKPLEFETVDPADYGLDRDTNANKYTRELEALGCVRLGDLRHVRGTSGDTINRIFVLPDERTYVYLNLMVSTTNILKFPAHVFYLIITDLADGRIVTINEGGGYRKQVNPRAFARRFPGVDDPAVLLAKHKKFVAEVLACGHELAPLADLAEFLERTRREHAETRLLMERFGYFSWSAAFRQSYELVRKEYLEPGGDA